MNQIFLVDGCDKNNFYSALAPTVVYIYKYDGAIKCYFGGMKIIKNEL